MKWLVTLMILSALLIAGCAQTVSLSPDAITSLNVYYDSYRDWTSICQRGSCYAYDASGKAVNTSCGMLAEFDATINATENSSVYCSFIYEGQKASYDFGTEREAIGRVFPIENIDFKIDHQITLCCGLKENSSEACKNITLPAKCSGAAVSQDVPTSKGFTQIAIVQSWTLDTDGNLKLQLQNRVGRDVVITGFKADLGTNTATSYCTSPIPLPSGTITSGTTYPASGLMTLSCSGTGSGTVGSDYIITVTIDYTEGNTPLSQTATLSGTRIP